MKSRRNRIALFGFSNFQPYLDHPIRIVRLACFHIPDNKVQISNNFINFLLYTYIYKKKTCILFQKACIRRIHLWVCKKKWVQQRLRVNGYSFQDDSV